MQARHRGVRRRRRVGLSRRRPQPSRPVGPGTCPEPRPSGHSAGPASFFFGGVTATWLVTQFHGELAYLSGYEAREGGASGGVYDPTAGSLLATLTFRLLL